MQARERAFVVALAKWRSGPANAVVGGRHAALLLGLPVVRPPGRAWPDGPRVRLVLPEVGTGRRGSRGAEVVVERARLRPADVVEVAGIPVTSPLRTAVDLARALPPRFGVVPLDAALREVIPEAAEGRQKPLAEAREAALAAALSARGRTGAARARAAAALADPRSESPLESITRATLVIGGLSLAVPQLWLPVPGGRCFRGDLGWPRHGVVGECDGWGKYGRAPDTFVRALRDEKRREDALRRAGWLVARWGWEVAVLRPHDLVADASALLDEGAARVHLPLLWSPTRPSDGC